MAKSSGKDESTQPLSPSQIVAVTPKPPGAHIPQNDRSVWKGIVVGADEFAPPKPQHRSRAGIALLLGVLGAGAAVGIFFALTTTSPPDKPAPAPAATPMAAPPADAATDAAIDAAIDAPADAAVDAAEPADAGVPVDAGVSKPAVKKPVGKRKLPPKPKRKLH